MKIILLVFGILLLLTGVVWMLQGINLLGGSVMSGQTQWTWIGLGTFAVGVVLLMLSRRRPSK